MSTFYFKDLSMTVSFLRKVVVVVAYAGLTYKARRASFGLLLLLPWVLMGEVCFSR
ncbi:Unknown protein sequence [Pseudomonas syringae pv. spinaceae]|uniref:Uncharacterized protein n=1 Tax=Pseudomonas syringae pv. spinaceae TaxID=264459 RepID=A0A0Q0CLU6_PSESX|nr:Unknown protein sequence [Pseudomonas syringae pv. spinaceae]